MSSKPFRDLAETNPYAPPSQESGAPPTGNPLLAPAVVLLLLSSLSVLLTILSFPGQVERIRALDESTLTSRTGVRAVTRSRRNVARVPLRQANTSMPVIPA